jgi:ABC-2 type transport system permease protein
MFYRTLFLIKKEFTQLFRDKLLAPLVILGPLAELLMIAWSSSQGIDHLPTAVLDLDNSNASRGLIVAMENTETFDPYYVDNLDQVTWDIERGQALAAWVIPRGFEAQLLAADQSSSPVQLVVDGSDVMSGQTAVSTAEGLAASYGQKAIFQPVMAGAAQVPLDMSLRVWFNEEMKESNYMIPSELGFIAAAIVAMLASMVIAKERELGTLEQLMVTPLRSSELVIGKSVMAVSLGFVLYLLMLAMVILVFDVPMRGSLPLLLVLSFLYMLVELGWGLMISAVAKTQMQALLITFAVIMVIIIFSGYAFPVDTMPPFMQVISNIFPLKHWLIVFRGILLKGAGIQELWPELLAILVLGIIIYTFTVIILRRNKLE